MKPEMTDHTIEMIYACPNLENFMNFSRIIEMFLKDIYGNENVLDFDKVYWSKSRHARVGCVYINLNGKSHKIQEKKKKCQ